MNMDKWSKVRLGFIGASAAAVAIAGFVACSGSENPPAGGVPGNTPDAAPIADAAPTQPDAQAVPKQKWNENSSGPRITVINASPDLGAHKLCLGTILAQGEPITFGPVPSPLPTGDTGVPVGGMFQVKLPDVLLGELPRVPLFPYVVKAGFARCAPIVADGGAGDNVIKQLDAIPPGTLKAGKAYIAAISGCANDDTDVSLCGGDDTTRGLHIKIIEIDNGASALGDAADATPLFQFVNLVPNAGPVSATLENTAPPPVAVAAFAAAAFADTSAGAAVPWAYDASKTEFKYSPGATKSLTDIQAATVAAGGGFDALTPAHTFVLVPASLYAATTRVVEIANIFDSRP